MIRKYYTGSLLFTAVCLALGAWLGWELTGTVQGTLGIVWIVLVLGVLEVSLSFDNAVVNATVLRDMDAKWRRRFLTWGIAIAVFGMRIIFPLAIVAIAALVNPIEAVRLAATEPETYQHIIEGAHVGIAGFGGAFLAMVGLKFFFDSDKEVHWIGVVERQLAKLSDVSAIEIGIVLLLLYGISTQLPAARRHDLSGLGHFRPADLYRGRRARRRCSAGTRTPPPARSCARASPPSSISKCSTPPSRSTG